MLHLNPHHTALNAIRVVLGVMLIFFTANAAPPRYDHVVIVVEENRTSGQIIGDTVNAPCITSLAWPPPSVGR